MALWKRSSSILIGRRLFCFPPTTTTISLSHSKGCFSSSSSKEEEEEERIKSRFEAWAIEHGKSYKTVEEKEKRFKIFRGKLRSIEKHNSNFPDCCKRELTMFSDQAWKELHHTYCYV